MVADMHRLCTHCKGLVDPQTYGLINRSRLLNKILQDDCLQGFGVWQDMCQCIEQLPVGLLFRFSRSVDRAVAVARIVRFREQACGLGLVEFITFTAEFAGHLNLSLVVDDLLHFALAERA